MFIYISLYNPVVVLSYDLKLIEKKTERIKNLLKTLKIVCEGPCGQIPLRDTPLFFYSPEDLNIIQKFVD